jgi:glyoxylase-like metal-dependent hydrolase (beta-lactamase superfamily II)
LPVPGSYLIGDETTGRAAVVDSGGTSRITRMTRPRWLSIDYVVETHAHADFSPGT